MHSSSVRCAASVCAFTASTASQLSTSSLSCSDSARYRFTIPSTMGFSFKPASVIGNISAAISAFRLSISAYSASIFSCAAVSFSMYLS